MAEPDAVIVGAGIAGLCCALHLQESGLRPLVLEASDGVGGRVRTDLVEGFRLDRGFQVLLTAYPEARRVLDLGRLDLRPFEPGALVRWRGRFRRVVDPARRRLAGLRSVTAPIGTLGDKLRVRTLRRALTAGSLEHHFARPETTTIDALESWGFSPKIVERFFRPWLGGVFLDRDLRTSSRMLAFVFRMFSAGDAVLPAEGMEAIPRQIADRLEEGTVRLGARVEAVTSDGVRLSDGQAIAAPAVVVATEGPAAARLVPGLDEPGSCPVRCVYYAADEPPIGEPILVLDGEGAGPINNLAIPSEVAPGYAPEGESLVSATVLGDREEADDALETAVRDQLTSWFGEAAKGWRHLRTYRIDHALPAQVPPALEPSERPVCVDRGRFVCGDHRDNASINGAMVSGRRAAEAVLAEAGRA